MSRRLAVPILVISVACVAMIAAIAADGKGATMESFAQSLSQGVDSRLKGKQASDNTRNIFSKKDHAAKKYTRNPNLWCADLVPQLTGCAVWKPPLEYVGERYGGVMITPRHILFCQHAHPAWDGGWMKVQPQVIRFVTADSKVVDMEMIANAEVQAYDLSVGLLNEAVPAGIHVMPLMPTMTEAQKTRLRELKVPDLSISQAGMRPPANLKHEAVAYPGPIGIPLEGARKPWDYDIYQGDSGTPRFFVTPAGLALYQLTGAGAVENSVVKKLIEACDASAIQRGVLKKATGLEPVVVKVEIPEK
ncbi:hypothetical protein [Haloferula sp. BvORR071]|uniref:hypothetical protein n=1 Tax=Haloferula sp. BvORR071 TaxID=1396141 RepID=UPI002240EDF2|nr:hypothetical protein [Haloferula sp. BvORR071]